MSKEKRGERTTREEELQERYANYEKALDRVEFKHDLWVDEALIPDGMEYRWLRTATHGVPDQGNVSKGEGACWTPVPGGRHPELASNDDFGKHDSRQGYYFRAGLVLYERPKYLGIKEMEKLNKHNYQVVTSIPAADNYLGDKGIPGHFMHNDTLTSKGIAFAE